MEYVCKKLDLSISKLKSKYGNKVNHVGLNLSMMTT
jgi:hypothetical protein